MEKVLIIGGTGFIGKNIIRVLKEHNVITGCYDLVDKNYGDYNYIGNVIYDNDLDSIISEYDKIVYLITSVSPKKSMENPTESYVNDIPLLLKVLDIAKENNIKRVVFASSGGTVYGDNGNNKSKESDFNEPLNHYAICKLTSEKILEMYNKLYNMENISLRISNPFGYGQNPNSNVGAITVFANKILNNEEITLFGDGNIVRDYIDVSSVALAFYQALQCDFQTIDTTPVFNIGSGNGLSLNEIINIISETLGLEPKINYQLARKFDVSYNVLDTTKAEKYLGYKHDDDEIENIKKYVLTLKKNREVK